MSDTTADLTAVSRRALREADLVMRRCAELATLTSLPGGIERLHLTPQHAAANSLAEAWMREAGLRTWVDAAGNLCGRLEAERDGLPALVLGSHLDSVTDAGAYDGVLGVLAAIAVAGRFARSARRLPFALEVVAFSDEEGTRFGNALSGSRAFAGAWDYRWWELEDGDGVSLYEAFQRFGLEPDRIADAARRPEDLVGYLEVHIEQGPVLDDADRPLGVVTSIAGARRFMLTVTGRAGHAGGTPYERRRDALVAASELVLAIERIGRESGTIATVGRLQAFPGGVNVIPGLVELSLDLRGERDADRDAAWARVCAVARDLERRRGVLVEATEIYRADAVGFDADLRAAVEAGIRATGDPAPLPIWSRAGHDGMAVADVTGVAMLFVRCAGGISHHPEESVTRDDVAVALDAFEAAVQAYADARRP